MARVEIPVSGWTCLRTRERDALVNKDAKTTKHKTKAKEKHTLVDVRGVGLLAGLATLLLLASGSGGSLLASFLLLSRSLASWGLATSAGLLFGSLRRHDEKVRKCEIKIKI